MKPKNFRKPLSYLNGDMDIPNNKHFIFLFYSRWRYLKTSNSDCRRFFNKINTIHLELFLRKVHCVLITINMKSDLAFIAINNIPCSIQEGSTKYNRHVVVLGHLKYNKVSQNSNISNNNGNILTDTNRYGS